MKVNIVTDDSTSVDEANTASSDAPPKTSIMTVISGVLAAAIGIQSNKNRENDFSSKSIVPYLIVGGVFTILFIVTLVTIASIAIA